MNTNLSIDKYKDTIYLNRIRIIASFFVVFIHITAYYFNKYPTNDIAWIIPTIYNCLSRTAVPLFIFVSGAIYLNENKQIQTKKLLLTVLRFTIIFLLWNFLYLCIDNNVFKKISNITFVFKYFSNYKYHLWYLLDYIMLLIFVPILRLICKTENKKQVKYLLIIFLIFGSFISMCNYMVELLPSRIKIFHIIQSLFSIVNVLNIWKNFDLFILFISGWYFSTFDFKEKIKLINIFKWVLGILIPVLTVIMCVFFNKNFFTIIADYYFLPNYLLTICIFLAFRYSKHSSKPNKFMDCLSHNSLEIYLSHVLILSILRKTFSSFLQTYSNSLLMIAIIPVFALVIYAISLLISMIINLLPKKIRKWIC